MSPQETCKSLEVSRSKPPIEANEVMAHLGVVIQYQDILSTVRAGDVVQVRYRDHVLFRDVDASQQEPRIMECLGKVDKVDKNYLRLTFETYNNPEPSGETRNRSTGLVILKSTILELRKL
jgi:hypothetical protein